MKETHNLSWPEDLDVSDERLGHGGGVPLLRERELGEAARPLLAAEAVEHTLKVLDNALGVAELLVEVDHHRETGGADLVAQVASVQRCKDLVELRDRGGCSSSATCADRQS